MIDDNLADYADPIIYDQFSAYGLRDKRLLEEIVAHPQGVDPKTKGLNTEFTELFWGRIQQWRAGEVKGTHEPG